MSQAFARLIAPLERSMRLAIRRAVLSLVNDSLSRQSLQLSVLADETRDDVQRFQNYGFTSVPFAGAEAIVLSVGSQPNHLVVIAADDRRYRKKGMEPGEVALYTDEGDYIILKRGRIVEVNSGTKLKVTAPLLEMNGDLSVTGKITAGGDVFDQNGAKSMAGMRAIYNAHTHADPQGGVTGPPSAAM